MAALSKKTLHTSSRGGARDAPRLRRKSGDPLAQILYWHAAISAAAEPGLREITGRRRYRAWGIL